MGVSALTSVSPDLSKEFESGSRAMYAPLAIPERFDSNEFAHSLSRVGTILKVDTK